MKLPPELLETIVARPDEQSGYVVAADWLTAQGSPWGELIAAQCRLEKENDPSKFMTLRRLGEALLASHGAKWLDAGDEVKPTWRWGFVERLSLASEPELLRRVLRSPLGALTREVVLTGAPASLRAGLAVLESAETPRLDSLALRCLKPLPPRPDTGRAAIPSALKRLESHGMPFDWSSLPPSLRALVVADLRDPTLSAALDATKLDALEHLELLDLELPLATTQRLIAAQPSLRVLHVEDDLPDDLAQWLATGPSLKHLEHLALGGPSTDAGLDAMLKHFARFARLKTLVLYGGVFGPTIKKWAYKQLPQLRFETRRPVGERTSRRK